jgi:low temperature requirement protein LtrA
MSDAGHDHVPHQRVGWFELFYDLVIVAAVGWTAHTFAEHPSWALGSWIAVWTLVMFVLWLLTSLHNNLFPGDHPVRRMLTLVQMLALVVAALGTVADEGLSNATGFIALAVSFGTVAVIYALPMRTALVDRRDVRVLCWTSGIAAAVLATGGFLPDDAEWTLDGLPPWILAVGVGTAAVAVFVVVGRLTGRLDEEHLGERLGQLVIIVLGESFVSLVSALGGLPEIPNPLFFVLTFVVVFAIWTVYFSSVLPAGMPESSGRLRAWLLTHWVLMFGAIGTSAAFSALTLIPVGDEVRTVAIEWSTLPLALVMLSLALLTWLGRAALTGLVRIHLVAAALLGLLAVVGLTWTTQGEAWEVAVGSLVVAVDALLCVRLERPYRLSVPVLRPHRGRSEE